MISSLFSAFRQPLPPALVAAREAALAKTGASLLDALASVEAARSLLESEKAALAACEAEIVKLTDDPGVDLETIRSWRERKELLTIQRGQFAPRIAAAEVELKTREAIVEQLHKAVSSAEAEIEAGVPDCYDDLPRLKVDLRRAENRSEVASAALDRAKAESAPAIEAYQTWRAAGATEAAGLKIIKSYAAVKTKLTAARAEAKVCEDDLDGLQSRVAAVEAQEANRRRGEVFAVGLRKLESRRPELDSAAAKFNAVAEHGARLFYSNRVFLERLQRASDHANGGYRDRDFATEMLFAEHFKIAYLPRLGQDGAFVSSDWRHNYGNFESLPVANLPVDLGGRNGGVAAAFKSAFATFEGEYAKLGEQLVEAMADIFSWAAERGSLFADGGDVAANTRMPPFPFVDPLGREMLPWRYVNLPPFRAGGNPIWHRTWEPGRLLGPRKSSEAAA